MFCLFRFHFQRGAIKLSCVEPTALPAYVNAEECYRRNYPLVKMGYDKWTRSRAVGVDSLFIPSSDKRGSFMTMLAWKRFLNSSEKWTEMSMSAHVVGDL